MIRPPFRLAAAALLCAAAASAQTVPPPAQRAVRRDIPITNTIQRALETGTRDSTGRPGRNYWQLRTDYSIRTSLDPATATVTGSETVVIHNTSPAAMPLIVLRLDQNIFRANVPRLTGVPEITDGMEITKITLDGRNVVMDAPAAGRTIIREGPPAEPTATGLDQTVARILLPEPIPPGATVTLAIDWSFRVPRVERGRGLRMGAWPDSLYQVAQWYPRVAKFDDLRGWDAEPYLGPSEFYNNFGRFDVRIDVPAGWVVGATGVLQNPQEVLTPTARERLTRVLQSDETVTIVAAEERGPGRATAAGSRLVWHFVADTVNDFAWSASDRYIWDATRATIPGRGAIPVHMLYTPGRAESWARAPGILRHALEFYSELWMPYAFPQLTMADGPETGMEYPMFIMSGVGAADHEVGHEWWPMMVGTNETWYGFMDEGFNMYMNTLSRAHAARQPAFLDSLGQRYGRISGNEYEAPLMWNANFGGNMYSFQAYSKAPLMLSMLGGVVGDSAVWRAMSEYAHAWRFRHPTPWDFAFFMNRALDRDLSWFWYSWLFTTDAVDGSIQDVRAGDGTATVIVRQDGQMPAPVVLRVELAPTGPPIRPMSNSTMLGDGSAIVTWPVDVWFGGSRTFSAVLDFGGRAIESITLDPFARFPDADVSDNTWRRRTTTAPQSRR
ncbi:MAG TPA: M1 family metallopeptidase [Longimicrobiales bacterium]